MEERPHGDIEAIVRQAIIDDLGYEQTEVGDFPSIGDDFNPHYVSIGSDGGIADYFEQSAVVDIDVFAPLRSQSKMTAFAIQILLLRYPRVVRLGPDERWVIDKVTCDIMPRRMPWDDESVRRTGAQYTLTLRR